MTTLGIMVILSVGTIGVTILQDIPVHKNDALDLLLKKSGHLLEYAILGLLLWRAFRGSLDRQLAFPPHSAGGQRAGLSPLSSMLTMAVGGLYAVSDELHQLLVANRHARIEDVVVDVAAVAAALGIIWLWERQCQR